MTNLLMKARTGRSNALAALPVNPGEIILASGAKKPVKMNYRYDPIPFISKRAQSQAPNWVH